MCNILPYFSQGLTDFSQLHTTHPPLLLRELLSIFSLANISSISSYHSHVVSYSFFAGVIPLSLRIFKGVLQSARCGKPWLSFSTIEALCLFNKILIGIHSHAYSRKFSKYQIVILKVLFNTLFITKIDRIQLLLQCQLATLKIISSLG